MVMIVSVKEYSLQLYILYFHTTALHPFWKWCNNLEYALSQWVYYIVCYCTVHTPIPKSEDVVNHTHAHPPGLYTSPQAYYGVINIDILRPWWQACNRCPSSLSLSAWLSGRAVLWALTGYWFIQTMPQTYNILGWSVSRHRLEEVLCISGPIR